jgi:ribosomal protein S19E (S16A)
MISGETLEDYFRRLNLDEIRRKFLENIKQGKHEENEIHEYYLKNGNRKEYSPIARDWYSIYMKRFVVHHHLIRRRLLVIDRATAGKSC